MRLKSDYFAQAKLNNMRVYLKFLLVGIITFLALLARIVNAGFGLILFSPIYIVVTIFHIVTLCTVIPRLQEFKTLTSLLILSQLIFIIFFLLSSDGADSTGGLTILVNLEYLGLVRGLQPPQIFLGKSGFVFQIIELLLLVALDIIMLIIIKKGAVTRNPNAQHRI